MIENISKYILYYEKQLEDANNLLQLLNTEGIPLSNKFKEEFLDLTVEHIQYACFFNSSFLDIATSLKGILTCESNWERRYFLKNGFVTIYETIKTYNDGIQKILRSSIKLNFQSFESRKQEIDLELREFRKKYQYDSVIRGIRNKAGAHYDKNFIEYYKNLQILDSSFNVKIISDFSNILMSLLKFWNELADEFLKKTEMG